LSETQLNLFISCEKVCSEFQMHSFISANCNSIELGLDDFCVCLLQTLFCKKRETETETDWNWGFFLATKSEYFSTSCNQISLDLSATKLVLILKFFGCMIFLQVSFFFLFFSSSFWFALFSYKSVFFVCLFPLPSLYLIVTFFRVRIATVLSVVKTVQGKSLNLTLVVISASRSEGPHEWHKNKLLVSCINHCNRKLSWNLKKSSIKLHKLWITEQNSIDSATCFC
jgi:hypothetical protein